MRSPVEVERQVVLTLYYLSDEGGPPKDSKCIWTLAINCTVQRLACVITTQLGETNVRGHRHKEDYVSIKMNLNEDIRKCPNL